jgi:hypothetical protein
MVFVFPDDDTLRFALTSGLVPPAVSLAAARAGRDADGRPWVHPSGPLPKALPTALSRVGVSANDDAPLGGREVAHWLQAVALRRDPVPPLLADQTPVLFELSDPAGLTSLVGEMLRLGNDRQDFRILGTESGRRTALLRVTGPPYYTFLRALDRLGPDAPRAYLAQAPHVWTEVGWTHPLVNLVRAATGQMLLLRPPQEWVYLDEAPFRDIYDVLDFAVPREPTALIDAEPTEKLVVPLRLAPGGVTESAELWVLAGDGVEQVDTLVSNADDRLVARLAFAVGEVDGRQVAVLRARPGKGSPPVLAVDALACRPYARLPNLFLPVGQRLRPPLRRDAVRQLLADDPDTITWLVPGDGGEFVPQSLPDAAFRPLADWVEYILDRDADALTSWAQAARFDFAPFVSNDQLVVAPRPAPRERKPRGPRPDADAAGEPAAPVAPAAPKAKSKAVSAPPLEAFPTRPAAKPSELQQRLKDVEQRFLAVDGPLDAPERQSLWPELAQLNAALRHTADAALCWAQALWENGDVSAASTWGWVESERALLQPNLSTGDLDRLFSQANPTLPDVRPLAAVLVWAAHQKPTPVALRERLPAMQQYLERHDHLLPVRIVWLAWRGLAHLTGADVLMLARVRDRLLERLLAEGLGAERDLPSFLRFAGERAGDRLRTVRERLEKLRRMARNWFEQTADPIGPRDQTPAYIDLLFAFGLARLGEATAARQLLGQAAAPLGESGDEGHRFLLEAFQYRTEQVLAGKPHAGALPAEQIEYVEQMRREQLVRPHDNNDPGTRALYVIDRMRQQSRVLDPYENFHPYRDKDLKYGSEMTKELAGLPDIADRNQLTTRIRALLDRTATKPAARGQSLAAYRVHLLSYALPLAPRVGESLTAQLLELVLPALDAAPPPAASDPVALVEQAELLERSLFFAAHFDHPDLVRAFVDRLVQLMRAHPGPTVLEVAGPLVRQSLRSLRRLGLRDEAQRMLGEITELVFRGRTLTRLKDEDAGQWPQTLSILVQLAAGWLSYEGQDRALPILNEARTAILRSEAWISSKDHLRYVALVCAYITALGQMPVNDAVARVEELLTPGKLSKLPNSQTSATHYSRFHLNIVEAVVLALANDDFILGPAARRWLDDDEYLVRRRIHRDVRAALAAAGL